MKVSILNYFFLDAIYYKAQQKTYQIYTYKNTNVNKNPTDATLRRYLFTAKLLYMFRVSQHPSSGVLKTVPTASGTGHTASRSDHVGGE